LGRHSSTWAIPPILIIYLLKWDVGMLPKLVFNPWTWEINLPLASFVAETTDMCHHTSRLGLFVTSHSLKNNSLHDIRINPSETGILNDLIISH
jgi:hypothetical protein